jgi:hypothetical protein
MNDNHDQIRRDNENARQGIRPKIHNEIPMRVPAEERLPGVITTEKEGTSK